MRHLISMLMIATLVACSGDSTDQLLVSARAHMAESSFKAATIELKNALQNDPDSAEARWLLGKLYLDTGDILAAEKELRRAESLGWAADDVRPALAQVLLAQGKFGEVVELNHKDLGAAAAASLLSSKAFSELALGKPAEADKLVKKALAKDPGSNEAKLVEARLLASQGDTTGSLIVLEEILEGAPENAAAWSLKGDILMRQQQLQEARDAYSQSIAHGQQAYADRVKRALISIELQEYEAAQADTTELLRLAPQHPLANYLQGLLHFQGKHYKDAITALSAAEPAAKQYPLILFYLASAHLLEGNQAQALVFADQFVRQEPENISGRKLLASIQLQTRQVKAAQETLQPALDNNPNDVGALNIMANALIQDGQTDRGLDLLARIAELQPDSPVAQIRLGAGMMISGQGEQASQHLETALEINPEYQQADILLVMNFLQKNDYEGAIQAAKAYQRRNIGRVPPYNLLGRVYLAASQPNEARDAFTRALSLEPGNPAANLGLAQMALEAEDLKKARQHYDSVLEHHPDNLPTVLQLAVLEAREKNQEAMLAWLEQAIEQHPAVLEPRLMLARYYLGSGAPEKISPLFADLDALQRQSRPVLEITALAQLSGQQPKMAHSTLEQLIASNPDTAQYHYLLAMAAERTGDRGTTKEELSRAHQLDPKHVPALVALARLSLAEQSQDDFEGYLDTLMVIAPDSPEVLRLRAIKAQQLGDSKAALAMSQQVFAASPTTGSLLELVAYQKLAGQSDASRKSLRRWIQQHPEDVTARLALANDLQIENDLPAAQAQYAAIIELDPDNVMALNNLAWNLREENPALALEYIRTAARSAPERADVLDTLAVIEHLNGENALAYRNIQRALAKAPDNLPLRYHRAMIEAALGKNDQAIATLKEITAEDAADFPERREAENLLKSLQG